MDCDTVKPGLKVKTIKLGDTVGMIIAPKHLSVRREGVMGTVKAHIPNHGGEVWFVKHEGSDEIGAYVYDEIEPA